MALTLTDEELAIVTPKRKDQDDLPTYFNSTLQTDVTISRDFEAFLILAPDDMKTSAISWIKKAVGLQKANKDRDDLVALAIAQEKSNAAAKINALDATLGDFNEFRTNFQTTSTFADVPEVQQFLFDLQRVVEELSAARDRSQFDDVVSQVIDRGTDRLKVSDPEIQELQSWTGVLSKYLQG